MDESRLHAFDRAARIQAIGLAAVLGLDAGLSLNFLPASLETLPDAIQSALDAARAAGIDARRLLLEVTEGTDPGSVEVCADTQQLSGHRLTPRHRRFRRRLFRTQPARGFPTGRDQTRQHLVHIDSVATGYRARLDSACDDLGIEFIAEGVETEKEYRWFKRIGVTLFQGYYFGRPAFESLSRPTFVG